MINTDTELAPRTAEENILCCVFMAGAAAHAEATEAGVTAELFADSRNAVVWGAMNDCIAGGTPVAVETVAKVLISSRALEAAGGYAHLTRVSWEMVMSSRLPEYTAEVKQSYANRRAKGIASRLLADLSGFGGCDAIGEAIAGLNDVLSGQLSQREKTWQEDCRDAEDIAVSMARANGAPIEGAIEWPWLRMNEVFRPMQAGQLVVIAARPSVGKSSLARPIAKHAAEHGKSVYFVSLEVGKPRVALSMAAASAGIQVARFHENSARDQALLYAELKRLHGLGITVSAKDRSLVRITSRARALRAQGKADLVIIDHGLLIQEVQAAGMDKVQAIARVTGALKTLAQELGIVVVLLWQLNRGADKDSRANESRQPSLSDLKGSGSLEEDADKVVFIHRPAQNPQTGATQDPSSLPADVPSWFVQISQEKGRDDGTGRLSFNFKRATASFTPISGGAA
jgi:replicative DNA helicase